MSNVLKPSFAAFLVVFFSLFTISQVAEAKRFGGGKSFGYSKSVAPKSFNKSPKKSDAQAAPKTAPSGAGAKSRSGMMGVLGGLAAGGLLAALFMGGGFEGIQIMDVLFFALIAFVLFKLFRHFAGRQKASAPQTAYESSYEVPGRSQAKQTEVPTVQQRDVTPEQSLNSGESIFGSNLGTATREQANPVSQVPDWFDATSFVEGAKDHFMTLQKAWDKGDVSEIESYCSPELFAAIQQEMQEHQAGEHHTVVDTLDAEIADMAMDGDYFVVSVRFSGFIEEENTEGAHAFNEVWHIRRLSQGEGNWKIIGIQQNH